MLTAANDTALGCGAAAHFSQLYLERQRSIASASMRSTVGINSLVSPSYLASHVGCRVAHITASTACVPAHPALHPATVPSGP